MNHNLNLHAYKGSLYENCLQGISETRSRTGREDLFKIEWIT